MFERSNNKIIMKFDGYMVIHYYSRGSYCTIHFNSNVSTLILSSDWASQLNLISFYKYSFQIYHFLLVLSTLTLNIWQMLIFYCPSLFLSLTIHFIYDCTNKLINATYLMKHNWTTTLKTTTLKKLVLSYISLVLNWQYSF